VGACLDAADELAAEGVGATVWDVRVVSPPDAAMLADAAHHALVVTAEDGVRHGGAGAFLVDALASQAASEGGAGPEARVLGIPRQYLAQGKADDILASLGLDGAGVAESVRRALAQVSGAGTGAGARAVVVPATVVAESPEPPPR
jgi:1-deoxy-D-xylulose-5-phosphate synthase